MLCSRKEYTAIKIELLEWTPDMQKKFKKGSKARGPTVLLRILSATPTRLYILTVHVSQALSHTVGLYDVVVIQVLVVYQINNCNPTQKNNPLTVLEYSSLR